MSMEVVQDGTKLYLQELQHSITRALTAVGVKAEGDVVGYITSEYIVDTGRLRNSITSQVDSGEQSVSIGTNVEYALAVHEGHRQEPGRYVPAIGKRLVASYVPGRPFLTTPVKSHIGEYADIFKEYLSK